MECVLKFSSPNWHTIIIVTKRARVKGFFKRERFNAFFIFMTMPSFKQVESNYGKKSSANEVVVGLLSFLIASILDTVNMVLFFQFELEMAVHAVRIKKKISKVNNF